MAAKLKGDAAQTVLDDIRAVDAKIKGISVTDHEIAIRLVKSGYIGTPNLESIAGGGWKWGAEHAAFRPKTDADVYQPVWWFASEDKAQELIDIEKEEKRVMEEDEAIRRGLLTEDMHIREAFYNNKLVYQPVTLQQLAYTDGAGVFHPSRPLPHFRSKKIVGSVIAMTQQISLHHNPKGKGKEPGKNYYEVKWVLDPLIMFARGWKPMSAARPVYKTNNKGGSGFNFDDPAPGIVPMMTTDLPHGEKRKRDPADLGESKAEKKSKHETSPTKTPKKKPLPAPEDHGDDYSLLHAGELSAMKSMDLPPAGDPTPMDDDATRSGFEQSKPAKGRGRKPK